LAIRARQFSKREKIKKLKKRQNKILICLPGLHKNGNNKDQETKGKPRKRCKKRKMSTNLGP
jgi:hypothetical protein